MKIIVTGGAGFVGSHLCGELLRRGEDVVCVDNLFTGRWSNVERHRESISFTRINNDITEPFPIGMIVDRIYNLACPASPVAYRRDPVFTMKTNVLGTINMLELAVKHGARMLQASTSEVYGDPDVHPQAEAYVGRLNANGDRSSYDVGKLAAETLCADYARTRGADVRVARIFNTYGPLMAADDGRVVSNMIAQALRGEPMTIYGDGSQTRSFCYVDDLVDGLIALMESNETGPMNLGNPGEVTMLDLAREIWSLTGSKSEIQFKPLPQDDPRRRCPDITRAQKRLHWEPKVPRVDGLKRTIEYFRGELGLR